MKFYSFSLSMALCALIVTPLCDAKTLNLYEQPKAGAKVTGTVDSDVGIIPIYTPKGSEWIKVANPKNGDVGWLKQDDLSNISDSTNSFTFSQQMINTGKGPHTYIIQYGTPSKLTNDQAQLMLKQIQENQAAIKRDTQKMMEDVFQNMNQQEWVNFPIVMPVVIMPQQKLSSLPTTPAPQKTQ